MIGALSIENHANPCESVRMYAKPCETVRKCAGGAVFVARSHGFADNSLAFESKMCCPVPGNVLIRLRLNAGKV